MGVIILCTEKDGNVDDSYSMMVAMIARIDVKYRVPDTRAEVKWRYFESLGFGKKITGVALVDSYRIDASLTMPQLKSVARLFENQLVERATVNKAQSPEKFDWAIEVGFLPGVTDNVGSTAKETIEDFLKKKLKPHEGVYASQVVFISGKISEIDARALADSLHNPLIQCAEVKSAKQFLSDKGMGMKIPKVALAENKSPVSLVNLEVDDEALTSIGKLGVPNEDGTRRGPLALDLASMKTIRDHFRYLNRPPTDIELESLAQTWSEHCKHTIFADPLDEVTDGLYKTYIKGATTKIRAQKGKKDFCVSVFSDNSGGIAFDEKYLVTHKVETHNTPSALDPFGGAITGIVGVNRDTIGFGLGAKPIINVYGFCLADPRDKTTLYRDAEQKQKMLSARRIMEGVIRGVNAGGNCSGIPTPQGFLLFDPRYRGKPLVFAGTVGLIPRKVGGRASYIKKARPGDSIVMVGGRVGQDGIHGATFSSEVMDAHSPATAVQIGDPITQKKLSDAIVKEARDKELYHSITDNGAGGLSCSVAEMARESGGCEVDLEKVPLKYPGLAPWQTWISESQERMTLSVPKGKWKAFQTLMQRRGVEATIIGKFTASGHCVVKYQGKKIMDADLAFLHDGRPHNQLQSIAPKLSPVSPEVIEHSNLGSAMQEMLKRPNIASYEFLSKQYDHEVQAGSVLKPLQGHGRINGDVSVERPLLDSPKGVLLSSGIVPSYSELDPYRMAAAAIDTAVRAAVGAGAPLDHLALLDNFCWCSSSEPERLFQLKEAVRACHDYAVAYGTPFISGKDSMFNDFKGFDEAGRPIKISIPPTLLISAIAVVPNVLKTVSLDLKRPGDFIYILGETYEEFGGSEYAAMMNKKKGAIHGIVPRVAAQRNLSLYKALQKAIEHNLVASSVSVHRGGLGIALCRTAMGGKLGIEVSLKNIPGNIATDTAALFSESQGRLIVSVAPKNKQAFEKTMGNNAFAKIGTVTNKKNMVIAGTKKRVVLPIEKALAAYRSTFKMY